MTEALLEALKAMYEENKEELSEMLCDLLESIAQSTDNELDDYVVSLVRKALKG